MFIVVAFLYDACKNCKKKKKAWVQLKCSSFTALCEAMVSIIPLLMSLLFGLAHAQIRVFNLRASNLPGNILGTTDGYVKVFCGSANLGETSVRNDNKHPWWEEEFTYFKAQQNDILRLEVHDSDFLFDDMLGVCQRQIKQGTHNHDCFLEKGGTLHYSYTLG